MFVTGFCGKAFLEHYQATGNKDSLKAARRGYELLRSEINTTETNDRKVYTYTVHDSVVVLNVNALLSRFFRHVGELANNQSVVEEAGKLLTFTLSLQSGEGA